MKIFRRPMFRKGGEAMTGIMENVTPRSNYKLGTTDIKEEDITDYISLVKGGESVKADPLTDFLLQFGPSYMSQRPIGSGFSGALATAGAAAKEPLADLVKAGRSRRSEDLALRAKAIDTLGVDDLRKFRNYAKAMLPEGATDADVQAKIKELLESQYKETSPFLKADSPEEKIFNEANRLVKEGEVKNIRQGKRLGKFLLQDIDDLLAKDINVKEIPARKIFRKGNLKKGVEPGVYFDDISGTYTRIGVNEEGLPFVEKDKITLEELIGG